ncbi:MAG: hypothetical protein JO122_18880 [Acetobacteraceae bacterium]|nr:hypothetical protein [Acetobacteraceae bacterium]
MLQWEFLDFLAHHARTYPNFHLLMRTEGTGTITEAGAVRGVRALGPNGEVTSARTWSWPPTAGLGAARRG